MFPMFSGVAPYFPRYPCSPEFPGFPRFSQLLPTCPRLYPVFSRFPRTSNNHCSRISHFFWGLSQLTPLSPTLAEIPIFYHLLLFSPDFADLFRCFSVLLQLCKLVSAPWGLFRLRGGGARAVQLYTINGGAGAFLQVDCDNLEKYTRFERLGTFSGFAKLQHGQTSRNTQTGMGCGASWGRQ